MKYHIQVVSSFDITDVRMDTRRDEIDFEGYDTYEQADKVGNEFIRVEELNSIEFYSRVIPATEENVLFSL